MTLSIVDKKVDALAEGKALKESKKRLIREAGRTPVERDTLYRPIREEIGLKANRSVSDRVAEPVQQ